MLCPFVIPCYYKREGYNVCGPAAQEKNSIDCVVLAESNNLNNSSSGKVNKELNRSIISEINMFYFYYLLGSLQFEQ